jgi:hypothetical protein
MCLRIPVQDVNLEALTGLRVHESARNAPAEDWFVDVGRHKLVWPRQQVAGIEVLAVDQRREPASLDLGRRDRRRLMAGIAHAVAPILLWRHHLELRFYGAVTEDLLDLQIDVTC